MSRKGPAKKHQLLPDPIYGSTVVAQLINKILLDGKKSIAENIVYTALEQVKAKTEQEPVSVLKRALDNIRPNLDNAINKVLKPYLRIGRTGADTSKLRLFPILLGSSIILATIAFFNSI